MTRSILLLIPMLLILGVPSIATAQSGFGVIAQRVQELDTNFDIADKNHDGKLDKQEAQSGPVPFIASNFDAIDIHHLGYVTKSDVHAYIGRMLMRSQPAPPSSSAKPL